MTDHRHSPPTPNTHTQIVVRGSPAVHVDHNNTPEKESRRENMRRTSKGKRESLRDGSDVGSGGTDEWKEG